MVCGVCVHVFMHVCVHICACVHVCVSVHVYMCVYAHVCVVCLYSVYLIACVRVLCHASSSLILHSRTLPLEGGCVIEASVRALSRPSPQALGYGHVPQCLAFCTFSGSGFRSRRLRRRHFDSQASPQPLLDNLASGVTACW